MNLELIKKEAESFFQPTNVLFPKSQLIEFAKHCVDKATAWQPIADAPKDGTEILLCRGKRVTSGHWMPETEHLSSEYHSNGTYLGEYPSGNISEACWMSWDGGFTAKRPPTHWQPLPQAPEDK